MRVFIATAALLLTACAGPVASGDTGATQQTAAPAGAAVASHAASPGGGSPAHGQASVTPRPVSGGGVAQATGTPGTGQPASAPALTVVLGSACVTPGGQQTIHISTHQQASVAYNTHYADGKAGGDYGGVRIGTTDAAGEYRDGWTVSPQAALGSATVQAGMSRDGRVSTAQAATFTVATHC